jgi:predicted  nucleic acid-binding Zn-ribbon protein
LEDQLAKSNDLKSDIERRAESLRREVDILTQDKNFLSRENLSLEERLKRMEDRAERNEAELLESKRVAHKYMERVLQTTDDVRGKFERDYSQELADLKERHTRELESAKNHLVDIYERRVEHLR